MGDIAERFRPKLGADWPSPLSAMLNAAVEQNAHHPENVVGRILESWAAEKELDDELRQELDADSLAMVLSDRHGGEWGDFYFGPWGSGTTKSGEVVTAPARDRLTAEMIAKWRQRAEDLDNHIARARYSDAAWDLAPLVGLKRDRNDAIRAIDSYIGQCARSRSELHLKNNLRRAVALAATIGDAQRGENARTSLLELCRLTESDACERLRFLACDLFLLDRNSDASDQEKSTILQWMEDGLQECVAQGDPFEGERYAERLDPYYRRIGDVESQKRIARTFGGLLESWAAKGDGMLAMHNYKRAHEVYQSAGLRDEAIAVRIRVQEATARTQDEMARFSTTVKISTEEMDEYVRGIVDLKWPEVLTRFVGEFLHGRADFERQLETWLKAATMYGLMGQTIITASGDSVYIASPKDDRESHTILKGAEVLAFDELFMARVLDDLCVGHNVNPEKLLALFVDSPLFIDDRYVILKRALNAYFLHDHVTFTTLVVPQVEHALRLLFRHAAAHATTTTRDSKRWRSLTLNQILDSDALKNLLGEDIVLYLRVVLTHDLGINARNLVCHGLVGDAWFTRGHADRMLHVLLLLTMLIRLKEPGAESSDARSEETTGASAGSGITEDK